MIRSFILFLLVLVIQVLVGCNNKKATVVLPNGSMIEAKVNTDIQYVKGDTVTVICTSDGSDTWVINEFGTRQKENKSSALLMRDGVIKSVYH